MGKKPFSYARIMSDRMQAPAASAVQDLPDLPRIPADASDGVDRYSAHPADFPQEFQAPGAERPACTGFHRYGPRTHKLPRPPPPPAAVPGNAPKCRSVKRRPLLPGEGQKNRQGQVQVFHPPGPWLPPGNCGGYRAPEIPRQISSTDSASFSYASGVKSFSRSTRAAGRMPQIRRICSGKGRRASFRSVTATIFSYIDIIVHHRLLAQLFQIPVNLVHGPAVRNFKLLVSLILHLLHNGCRRRC